MGVRNNITFFQNRFTGKVCRLVAVSKTHPVEKIREAYDAGQRIFGENKVQEMCAKQPELPQDIEWHLIGHLQSNKVKQVAPFVALIHSVDSFKLLEEINKQGKKNNRTVPCLLQVHIATEETKFGFDETEIIELISSGKIAALDSVKITGLMGMATFTDSKDQVRREFKSLKNLFDKIKGLPLSSNIEMKELSMGMSQDYEIAMEEGSTLVRIGTAIFGGR
ncbi:YggS family pyridoxal phosphate enzyme [Cytophagales bacterium WSM2-2]|nr:YggS family pyridoxal phosphate enzyme [Cytophagales bacterium WSM2-2]